MARTPASATGTAKGGARPASASTAAAQAPAASGAARAGPTGTEVRMRLVRSPSAAVSAVATIPRTSSGINHVASALAAAPARAKVATDPETGTAATLALDVLVLAIPAAEESSGSGLTGRLVVLGVRPDAALEVAGATLTRFLSVSYSR